MPIISAVSEDLRGSERAFAASVSPLHAVLHALYQGHSEYYVVYILAQADEPVYTLHSQDPLPSLAGVPLWTKSRNNSRMMLEDVSC